VTIDPRPSQIWVYDLQRGTGVPLTTQGHNISPSWTRDGQRVAFSSSALVWAAADWARAAKRPRRSNRPGRHQHRPGLVVERRPNPGVPPTASRHRLRHLDTSSRWVSRAAHLVACARLRPEAIAGFSLDRL
jgi:hypothetical protein